VPNQSTLVLQTAATSHTPGGRRRGPSLVGLLSKGEVVLQAFIAQVPLAVVVVRTPGINPVSQWMPCGSDKLLHQ
jgi:hypothetical protein